MEQERIAYNRVAPAGIRAMLGLEQYVKQSGLEPGLLEFIRTRVSEINGCAYCIDMHTKYAHPRRIGVATLRAAGVARDAVLHRPRALAWRALRAPHG